jgi:hypothetical protein
MKIGAESLKILTSLFSSYPHLAEHNEDTMILRLKTKG